MKKKSHDKLGGNLQDPHMRIIKPLKVRTLKDNLDFVPEPPADDREEITVDGGFTEVTVTATELDMLYAKINAVDRKLDYLLDILKSKK